MSLRNPRTCIPLYPAQWIALFPSLETRTISDDGTIRVRTIIQPGFARTTSVIGCISPTTTTRCLDDDYLARGPAGMRSRVTTVVVAGVSAVTGQGDGRVVHTRCRRTGRLARDARRFSFVGGAVPRHVSSSRPVVALARLVVSRFAFISVASVITYRSLSLVWLRSSALPRRSLRTASPVCLFIGRRGGRVFFFFFYLSRVAERFLSQLCSARTLL